MSVNQPLNVAYGLSQALLNVFPFPIQSTRNPGTGDKAQIGTLWVNKSLNEAYVLTSIVNNSATWLNLESSGGSGNFNSLMVTGPTVINATGTADTNIGCDGNPAGTASSGNINIGATINYNGITTIGGNGDTFIGPFSTNSVFVGATSCVTTLNGNNIKIGQTLADGPVGIGNGASGITLDGDVTGTGIIQTSGNIITTAGNLQVEGDITTATGNITLSGAAHYIELPGPVRILTGAGAPSNGIALHVGDMYINTTAATAATRIYVATGVGAWTNVTCAA